MVPTTLIGSVLNNTAAQLAGLYRYTTRPVTVKLGFLTHKRIPSKYSLPVAWLEYNELPWP